MKKRLVFLLLFLALAAAPIVSAQSYGFLYEGAQQFVDGMAAILTPVVGALIGPNPTGIGNFTEGEIFWIRVLLLILLFIMVNMAVKAVPRLGENKAVSLIMAAAISIIAVRYMSGSELIYGILLPYGVLGVALTTILPFLIYFYFLHATKMGGLGRRLGWGIFGAVFIFIFISRYEDIPTIGRNIYFVIAGLIVLAFAFDKGIHRYFFMHEMNVFYSKAKSKSIASLQAEYMNILHVNSPEAEKRRDEIEKNLKRIGGDVP